MVWRNYFAEELDKYFRIFLGLVVSAFFISLLVDAERWDNLFILCSLIAVAYSGGSLHGMLPQTDNRKLVIVAVWVAVLFFYSFSYLLFKHVTWPDPILLGFIVLPVAAIFTPCVSILVFDEVAKARAIEKTPG